MTPITAPIARRIFATSMETTVPTALMDHVRQWAPRGGELCLVAGCGCKLYARNNNGLYTFALSGYEPEERDVRRALERFAVQH